MSTPPTFADFLREMDRYVKEGSGAAGADSSSDRGSGTLRGTAEAWRDRVDLEFQDLLEEYFRSLADPALRKRRK